MKRNVVEPTVIDDGKHTGVIIDVEERKTKQGYEYIDLHIGFKQGDKEVMLKPSYPDIVTLGSRLGKLLARFNIELVPGQPVELDKLKEKLCEFMTITEPGKDNIEYARVICESVKPVE